jgi:hypothetical protein
MKCRDSTRISIFLTRLTCYSVDMGTYAPRLTASSRWALARCSLPAFDVSLYGHISCWFLLRIVDYQRFLRREPWFQWHFKCLWVSTLPSLFTDLIWYRCRFHVLSSSRRFRFTFSFEFYQAAYIKFLHYIISLIIFIWHRSNIVLSNLY